MRIRDAAHEQARRRAHPFDLGWALTVGAHVFDYLREPEELLRRVAEADRVGRESNLPFVTQVFVPIYSGIALIRKGQVVKGMASLERGVGVWEQSGGRSTVPI
jgi:hypothetical protein